MFNKIFIKIVKDCAKIKKLANELSIRLSSSQFEHRNRISAMKDIELNTPFQIVDAILKKPIFEIDILRECLPGINVLEATCSKKILGCKKNR